MARRAGYHLVRANYYSPIPDLDALPERIWTQPDAMPGLDCNLDAQVAFLDRELGPFVREFDGPADPPGNAEGYHLRNEFFNEMDAEILYAMIRRLAPKRVVEIGSGYSTLVIAGAARRNREEGNTLRHQVCDPYPSPVLGPVREQIELHPISATEIAAQRVAELEAGDVLFIDSTHTVKPAGDVVHLLLGVLPMVASGLAIHLHDIFRPFEYPRQQFEYYGSYWQEHHLVQAFLAFNGEFEIVCANQALAKLRYEQVRKLIQSLTATSNPSSLWLRRR